MPFESTRRRPAVAPCIGLLLLGSLALAGCENMEVPQIGPTLTDEQPLSLAVLDALGARPETMNQRIDVKTVNADVVRLSGTVDTDATRQTAEQVAQGVPGVRSVVNTLFVRR